jgi:biopolymer transport protein ExbB
MSDILHQISFGLMALSALIAVAVSIERVIFTAVNMTRANQVLRHMDQQSKETISKLGRDTVSNMVNNIHALGSVDLSPELRQDRIDAYFLSATDELKHRLWMLDTVVTAAPLMGLLGTIFGIVDTFLTISKSGISEPAAISAGIGTALYATAVGISIALTGLVAFNFLTDRIEKITERLKMIVLHLTHS